MSNKETKMSDKDYEKLGKLLFSIGEIDIKKRKQIYKTQFIKGIFGGFGSVLGATIVIGIFLFVLSLIGNIPLVGNIADNVRSSVENR